MQHYVNSGAPIPRADGSWVDSHAVFVPTEDERRRLAYKLRMATAQEVERAQRATRPARHTEKHAEPQPDRQE